MGKEQSKQVRLSPGEELQVAKAMRRGREVAYVHSFNISYKGSNGTAFFDSEELLKPGFIEYVMHTIAQNEKYDEYKGAGISISCDTKKTFSPDEIRVINKLNELVKAKTGKEITFYESDTFWTVMQVKKANTKIDDLVTEIKILRDEKKYTPLEQFLYAYNEIAKRAYMEEEKGENPAVSRSIYSVLNQDKIVCVGYAQLLKEVCSQLELDGLKCFTNVIMTEDKTGKIGGHANNIVYLKDEHYNIDGFFYADPCWDCVPEAGNESEMPTFAFCLVPVKDIDYSKKFRLAPTANNVVRDDRYDVSFSGVKKDFLASPKAMAEIQKIAQRRNRKITTQKIDEIRYELQLAKTQEVTDKKIGKSSLNYNVSKESSEFVSYLYSLIESGQLSSIYANRPEMFEKIVEICERKNILNKKTIAELRDGQTKDSNLSKVLRKEEISKEELEMEILKKYDLGESKPIPASTMISAIRKVVSESVQKEEDISYMLAKTAYVSKSHFESDLCKGWLAKPVGLFMADIIAFTPKEYRTEMRRICNDYLVLYKRNGEVYDEHVCNVLTNIYRRFVDINMKDLQVKSARMNDREKIELYKDFADTLERIDVYGVADSKMINETVKSKIRSIEESSSFMRYRKIIAIMKEYANNELSYYQAYKEGVEVQHIAHKDIVRIDEIGHELVSKGDISNESHQELLDISDKILSQLQANYVHEVIAETGDLKSQLTISERTLSRFMRFEDSIQHLGEYNAELFEKAEKLFNSEYKQIKSQYYEVLAEDIKSGLSFPNEDEIYQ